VGAAAFRTRLELASCPSEIERSRAEALGGRVRSSRVIGNFPAGAEAVEVEATGVGSGATLSGVGAGPSTVVASVRAGPANVEAKGYKKPRRSISDEPLLQLARTKYMMDAYPNGEYVAAEE